MKFASHWMTVPLFLALIFTATPAWSGRYSVHDGDTFRIGRERIRVLGMDAPEIGYRARCTREQNAAVAARDFLAQKLATGEVKIERHGHDVYGRTLARVYINRQDIAVLMLSMGLAKRYTPRRHPDWCNQVSSPEQ